MVCVAMVGPVPLPDKENNKSEHHFQNINKEIIKSIKKVSNSWGYQSRAYFEKKFNIYYLNSIPEGKPTVRESTSKISKQKEGIL